MSDDDVRTQSSMESSKDLLCLPTVQFQTCFKNVRLAFCLQTRGLRLAADRGCSSSQQRIPIDCSLLAQTMPKTPKNTRGSNTKNDPAVSMDKTAKRLLAVVEAEKEVRLMLLRENQDLLEKIHEPPNKKQRKWDVRVSWLEVRCGVVLPFLFIFSPDRQH
jgi:hypothetical protein